MPNFSTFNRNADDLRTSIFGTDAAGEVRAARTDSVGRLDIVGEVTVETIGVLETVETILGGTINTVNEVTTIQGGTINTVDEVTTIQGGTINTVDEVTTIQGGTINTVDEVTTIQGGTINTVDEVTTIQGGTINTVDEVTTLLGGTINTVDEVTTLLGGTINTVDEVTTIQGGTINTVDEVTTIVSISQQNFVEDDVQGVEATDTTYNPILETDLRRDSQLFKVYTYFVTNQTPNTLDVRIEVSPNDIDWFEDVEVEGILDETVAIVPQRFGKYTRVQYRVEDESTTIDVWFNAQG